MGVPKLLTTQLTEEDFAGVRYHIQGELVPVLQVELSSMPVFFEHHILLWKDPNVEIKSKALPGLGKRMLAGMPVFITQASGPGFRCKRPKTAVLKGKAAASVQSEECPLNSYPSTLPGPDA